MSRLDKLKEQHPDLNVSIIDLLVKADPSDSYKYLPFLIKTLRSNFAQDSDILGRLFMKDNLSSLQKFEEHSKANRIKNNDISSYNSFKQIEDEVKQAEEALRIKELEKQVKKIYSDDDWLVIIPLSYESAKMYGANTKWCVTQEKYWNQYIDNYKILYIIDKKKDLKWAISSKDSESLVEGWQSDDNPINPFMIPIPSSILAIITDEIRVMDSISDMPEYKNEQKKIQRVYETWGGYNGDYIETVPAELSMNEISQVFDNSRSMDVDQILGIMHKLGMTGGGRFGM